MRNHIHHNPTTSPLNRRSFAKAILGIIAVMATSYPATAAVFTTIPNLSIAGDLYNVTFHVGATPNAFNTIFDADNDAVFAENDSSIVNHAPTFFGDKAGADAARDAIIAVFSVQHTHNGTSDAFFVPYTLQPYTVGAPIGASFDINSAPAADQPVASPSIISSGTATNGSFAFASFEPALISNVPVPSALFMFAPGLLALTGFRKKHHNKA